MTKTMSIRLDDDVAALVAERAARKGISINQEINDALARDAANDVEATRERAIANMQRYDTVMRRLG